MYLLTGNCSLMHMFSIHMTIRTNCKYQNQVLNMGIIKSHAEDRHQTCLLAYSWEISPAKFLLRKPISGLDQISIPIEAHRFSITRINSLYYIKFQYLLTKNSPKTINWPELPVVHFHTKRFHCKSQCKPLSSKLYNAHLTYSWPHEPISPSEPSNLYFKLSWKSLQMKLITKTVRRDIMEFSLRFTC